MNKKKYFKFFLLLIVIYTAVGVFKFVKGQQPDSSSIIVFDVTYNILCNKENPAYISCQKAASTTPNECYNGPIPGEKTPCGEACPKPSGLPMSRYVTNKNCYEVGVGGLCVIVYLKQTTWTSMADKLQPYCPGCGKPADGYLAAGGGFLANRYQDWGLDPSSVCTENSSGRFYIVCCTLDGKVGHSGPSLIQDRIDPPTEGMCIAGDPKIVYSGLSESDLVPPGQPSPYCEGISLSSLTPPPPPPPSVSNRKGVCNPYVEIKMAYGNNQKSGRDFDFNTEN